MAVVTPRSMGTGGRDPWYKGDGSSGIPESVRFRMQTQKHGYRSGRRADDTSPIGQERHRQAGRAHDISPKESQGQLERLTRLPRIVVRDRLGRELDTFTTLQEAIYRARWNVQNTCEAQTPREWRLPKAPVPSKPDYSRREAQHPGNGSRRHPLVPKTIPFGSVVEIGVEDVSYVANRLRQLPSLGTLPGEFLGLGTRQDKDYMYFHIVARLLLHEKIVSGEDKREALYEFPGFCTGCRRAGFCYSCRRGGGNFHVHQDRVARTGGGYTYWKRDVPEGEDPTNHPRGWGLKIPEHQLKLLLDSGNTLSVAAKEALRKRLIAEFPWLKGLLDDGVDFERLKQMNLVLTAEEMVDSAMVDEAIEGAEYRSDPDLLALSPLEKFLQTRDMTRKRYTFKLKRPTRSSTQTDSVDTGISPGRSDTGDRERDTERSSGERSKGGAIKDGERLGAWDSDSVNNTSYVGESDERDEDQEDTPSKKSSLYKAPRHFKLKKTQRKSVVSRSPFSENRQYDIPKGKPFDIKKSDKSTTKFVDIHKSGHGWKEPRKFELAEREKKTTPVWHRKSGDGDRSGRQTRPVEQGSFRATLERTRPDLDRSMSPDSGLDSEHVTESIKESTIGTSQDAGSIARIETESEITGLLTDQQYDSGQEVSGSESRSELLSPDANVKKRRSAIVKKSRSPIQIRKPKSPEMTPEPPMEETMVDTVQTPDPPSRQDTPPPTPPEVYRSDMSLPDLPQYQKARKESTKSKAKKFMVEAPQPIKTPPKKRKGPPKVRKLPKIQYQRKSKPAEAPVTTETLQDVNDPLDFLAKYCIINPNRLPFYEVLFENMVSEQTPRYERRETAEKSLVTEREVTEVSKVKGKKSGKKSNDELSDHELKLAMDMMLLNHGHGFITDKIGASQAEEYREKIVYTLDSLQEKVVSLERQLAELDAKRIFELAEGTRQHFPEVCAHGYIPPDKKKGKKGKKSKKDQEPELVTSRSREPVSDPVIVDRLTDSQLNTLSEEPNIRQLNLERERTQEKTQDIHQRIQQLEGEKLLLDILCADSYYSEQSDNHRPDTFRRQQSQLYNKLHPDPDYELDLELFEEALQQINNHLLTDQEFKYIYFVLDLPGRSRINFRLFSVIAALSEKVTQLDPVIRDLINKFDYNALDVKMDKCKDLFHLLEDDKLTSPAGGAPASNLALELTAGGLTPLHINYVLSKFNREGKGSFDFMDFVTYIPLFIEIHERIITDPLNEEQDL